MAQKYFSRQEAEELLPLIGHCLEEAREIKRKVESLDLHLARAATRVLVLGGSVPPYRELSEKRAERGRFGAKLEEELEKIQRTGCVLKDLDEGLVDFPSLRAGEEIHLCWKLGEKRIEYWHSIHECFAGRKPLDEPPCEKPTGGSPRVQ